VERCRRCTSGRQQERRRAAVSCPSRARLLTHMQQVRVWDHLPIPELPVAGDDRIWLGIGCRRMMFRVWLGIARAAAVRDDRISRLLRTTARSEENIDRMAADIARQTDDVRMGGGQRRVGGGFCGLPLAARKTSIGWLLISRGRLTKGRRFRRRTSRSFRLFRSIYIGKFLSTLACSYFRVCIS